MEFWGIEIKRGSPIKVEPEYGYMIHVTQVTLGESKKVKDEAVLLYVKVGDGNQKHLIGNLSQKIPQLSMDLVFEQDFELSHECQNSSVFVLGYKSPNYDEQEEDIDSDEEEIPMDMFQNQLEKSNANGVNDQKANLEAGESDLDDEDESDSDEMGSDDDEDEDDSDEEEEEEEEEAPLKVEPPSKKRPNGGAVNNSNASKKAKVAAQQKHLGGGHKGRKCC